MPRLQGRDRTETDRSQLVVTGSSAGGIEALSRLLASLPPQFPAPIVIAQHLDPRVPSHLAAILGKRTPLKVLAVEDDQRLEAGTVYVVPSDRNVEISDGHVSVRTGGQRAPNPRSICSSRRRPRSTVTG